MTNNPAEHRRAGEWEATPLLLRIIGYPARRRRIFAPLLNGGLFDRWQYETEIAAEERDT